MCTCSCYFIHFLLNSSLAVLIFGLCPTVTHEAMEHLFLGQIVSQYVLWLQGLCLNCSNVWLRYEKKTQYNSRGPQAWSKLNFCTTLCANKAKLWSKEMTYFFYKASVIEVFFLKSVIHRHQVSVYHMRGNTCSCMPSDSNSTDSVLMTSIVALQKQEAHTVLYVCWVNTAGLSRWWKEQRCEVKFRSDASSISGYEIDQ